MPTRRTPSIIVEMSLQFYYIRVETVCQVSRQQLEHLHFEVEFWTGLASAGDV